jgi:hypothetical protein
MIPGGWLGILAIGIILGAIGQGARTIVGFKKFNDDNDPAAVFDGVRLLISFGIGGVAGALAAITILPETGQVTRDQLFGIAAAGYAGTDFIEGFISRLSGGTSSSSANSSSSSANSAPLAAAPAAASTSSDDAVG